MNMKIIGGKYKGRNFYMPRDIRPTQSIARKALFDILGQDLEGVVFLELFAGSGAVGLEALSRGASKVTFVEKEAKVIEIIEKNISLLNVIPYQDGQYPYELINSDSFATIKHLARQNRKFDIVFLDPPYGRGLAKKALKTLTGYDILQPNCTVAFQHDKREILPDQQGRFLLFRQRQYGSSVLTFYNTIEIGRN